MALRGMSDTVAGPECEPHPNEYRSEQVPEKLTHDIETVENEYHENDERCTACGKTDRGINPFERCGSKNLAPENQSRIVKRAEIAEKRDHSLHQFSTVGMRDDSMLGVPARGDG